MRGQRPSAELDTKVGPCVEASDLLFIRVLDLDVDEVLALEKDNSREKHCIVGYNIQTTAAQNNICSKVGDLLEGSPWGAQPRGRSTGRRPRGGMAC